MNGGNGSSRRPPQFRTLTSSNGSYSVSSAVFAAIRLQKAAFVSASIVEYLSQLDHCLQAPELARILGIHRITVYKLAAAGEIPSFRIATAVRFDPRVVAKWLREREAR